MEENCQTTLGKADANEGFLRFSTAGPFSSEYDSHAALHVHSLCEGVQHGHQRKRNVDGTEMLHGDCLLFVLGFAFDAVGAWRRHVDGVQV